MYCSISGEVPLEPVVSSKSGHVFEKRLILKALEASQGRCPATGGELAASDLIGIQADLSVRPRPVTGTSVPGMLAMFQNEWDEVMLETHELKQQLHATRKELSHALYQHDAACRVIARLSRERDEARSSVAELQRRLAEAEARPAASEPMDVDGWSEATAAELTAFWERATKARKKRIISPSLAGHDEIRRWTKVRSTPVGAAATTAPVAWLGKIAVGCADGAVAALDPAAEAAHRAQPFASALLSLAATPTLLVACDAHALALVTPDLEPRQLESAADDSALFAGVAAHPAGDVGLATRRDGAVELWRLDGGGRLYRAPGDGASRATAPPAFHPDGLIAAQAVSTAEAHLVRVWDVKERATVHTFEGHDAPVVDLAFSENGYYMASAAGLALKLWDLRKLRQVHHFDLETPAAAVAFDFSGKYLAAASNDRVTVSVVKEWSHLAHLPLDAPPAGLLFQPDAAGLLLASTPGALDLFMPPPAADETT